MLSVRRILATSAVAVVTLTSLAVGAPAQAVPDPGEDTDPPCEWEAGQWGTHSDCDGLSPAFGGAYYGYCLNGSLEEYVDVVKIGPSGNPLAEIILTYNWGPGGSCRVVYATIRVLKTYATDCYVKLERNSDQQAYRVGGAYLQFRDTPILYDASVTSFAWGYCKYNGQPYSARTRNY